MHSLPESKRYPESKKDELELLNRHRRVASAALDIQDLTLFVGIDSNNSKEFFEQFRWAKALNFTEFNAYNIADEDEDSYYLHIFQTEFDWSEIIFNQIVLDVANENISSVTFFCQSSGNVYAPYDGGADLFFPKNEKLIQLKKQFSSWLSKRKDSL